MADFKTASPILTKRIIQNQVTVSDSNAIDLSSGNYFNLDVTADAFIQFINPPLYGTAHSFTLSILNEGNYVIEWATNILFENKAPTEPYEEHKRAYFVFVTTGNGLYYGKSVTKLSKVNK
jgi:hypothetical protein